MKTNILDQFAADTVKTPATVTGGVGLVPSLLSGLLGGTNVGLGVNVGSLAKVGAAVNVGSGVNVGATVDLGGNSHGSSGGCSHPSCH